jgi:hypothetical protein
MQAEILEWMKLFVQCMKLTKDLNSVLLLLGGYSSHTKHIAAIGAAHRNGIVMLCFLFHFKIKLRGFSPQANYTDRATAACRRS